jgi:hypothetical protein
MSIIVKDFNQIQKIREIYFEKCAFLINTKKSKNENEYGDNRMKVNVTADLYLRKNIVTFTTDPWYKV